MIRLGDVWIRASEVLTVTFDAHNVAVTLVSGPAVVVHFKTNTDAELAAQAFAEAVA